jgi:hypothetical protein
MEHSPSIKSPVAIARPRGTPRLEAFSPKLDRQVMFYRRASLEQWILIEADPAAIAFCERPGYVQAKERKYHSTLLPTMLSMIRQWTCLDTMRNQRETRHERESKSDPTVGHAGSCLLIR